MPLSTSPLSILPPSTAPAISPPSTAPAASKKAPVAPLANTPPLAPSRISSLSIPLLLEWWQQRKRLVNACSSLYATLPKADDIYLQAYYRLMEVYSVVKAGGVKTQTEAVHAFASRESRLLKQRLADIETAKELAVPDKKRAREKVEQEFDDLRSANDWRLNALVNITPEEEAVVKEYLPDIERTLMQSQRCA